MANKVKIYSTLKSGKVFFDGARVSSKEIGTLEVEAHPNISNRIRIKSLTQFKRGSSTQYRVFFGKLNINRVQNEAGQNLVADLGMDRDAVIAYVNVQITKPIVTEYFEYNPVTDRLEANKNIEVKKHGFFIGGKYKMASGNSNLYYEDLATGANAYPVMGEVFDQSLAENQVAGAGTSTPKMRVFGDYQSIPLGGSPVNDTAINYDGENYFPFNISGVGITVRMGEVVSADQQLKYEIVVDGISVYIQYLDKQALAINQDLTWYFDHPLDIEAGTTLRATIYKVSTINNQEVNDGILQVCEGDATPTRYQTAVLNRFFEDKDLELISPYTKYQAMDFGLDSTGSTILLRDLSLGAESLLQPHAVNTLEAVAEGTTIIIKQKGGAKVIVASLPVSGASIDGSFVNSVLNQAVIQLNALFTNTAGFASSGGNPVTDFVLSGDDLTISLEDGTSYSVDVTTLGVSTDNFVSSGAVVGTNIVLTMDDASEITIDASNMINGSTLTATNDEWFFAFGAKANTAVSYAATNVAAGVGGNAPFYFGKVLTRGSEIRFNQFFSNKNMHIGLWDGPTDGTVLGTYNPRLDGNWNTNFHWNGQAWIASVNTTLTNVNNGLSAYTPVQNSYVAIRFLDDGHLVMVTKLADGTEVEIGKTTIPFSVTEFSVMMAADQDQYFPAAQVTDTNSLWTIVHDLDGDEDGIVNGIQNHTIIKSGVSIEIGEKIMFMLDEVGQGDYFGTNYTNAATGVATAETQLDNTFIYQTNEAIVIDTASGVSDWTPNTSAPGYFYAASLHQYRDGGGAGTIQGMFSLRFNTNGTLTIWDEDSDVLVATATMDPTPGSSVHLYMGVKGARAYYSIPVISKQTIGGGSQPDVNYAPVVADQTASVEEGKVLNYQIVSSDNIVNQFVETDAPSWMFMDQASGVLSGTAPAFLGTAADTIVVNCKAGNAIGGSTSFTVTISVTDYSLSNTKSLKFPNGGSSFLSANPSNAITLARGIGGGIGAAEEWTISMWVKPANISNVQTLLWYGTNNALNEAYLQVYQFSGGNLGFTYGEAGNQLRYYCLGNFVVDQWNHVLITYDGNATTNDAAGTAAFNITINGVWGWSQTGHTGGGWTGSLLATGIFRVGKGITTNYDPLRDGVINQIGIWDSNQYANRADIYNSGATQDLGLLAEPPVHYWEAQDSITTITDQIGNADFTGYNFATGDLVTDAP